jgi:hypothetical protein
VSRGVETSARDRSEIGRIRGSRRMVTMSFGGPLKLSFGPGGVFGPSGGGARGWRYLGGGGRPGQGSATLLGHPTRGAGIPIVAKNPGESG